MSEKRRKAMEKSNADPSAKAKDTNGGQRSNSGPGHEWGSLSRRQRLVAIVALVLMAIGILAAGLAYVSNSGLIKRLF